MNPPADMDDRNAHLQDYLQRCALGDSAALRELYDLAAPQIYGLLLRILKRKETAEDALQEVFVRIWHRASYYSPEKGKPATWLLSVARYYAFDLLRRSRREVPVVSDLAPQDLSDSAEDGSPAGTAAARLADQGLLDYCLERLTAPQRRCIRFAYLEGYSRPELAVALKTPLGTVKTWIRRGLEALRKCIEHEV